VTFQGIGYFQALARYNQWANARLYAACLALNADDYARDRGAFFGSIGNTLNHILVADRIWLARFEGKQAECLQLDALPYPDRDVLWAERQKGDAFIVTLFGGYGNERLSRDLDYMDTEGFAASIPAPVAFGHFFNHQTHHRGQAHGMVSQAGAEPPALDFSYFYRESQG